MILLRVVLISSIFLLACTNSSEELGGEQKEFLTDEAPPVDSLAEAGAGMLSDSVRQELEKYFTPEHVEQLDDWLIKFYLATSDTLLEQNYRSGVVLMDQLYTDLIEPQTTYLKDKANSEEFEVYSIYNELINFNGNLGPLIFGCTAECTDYDLTFKLTDYKQAAQVTNGKADDAFFSLLHFVEGDYGFAGHLDFKVWHIQYIDYAGSTTLGDASVLKTVKNLQQYKKTHSLFKEEIEIIHNEVLDVLTGGHIYEYTLEEVLAEYTKILRLSYFSEEETNAIQKQHDELKNNSSNYQFNCANGDCVFG